MQIMVQLEDKTPCVPSPKRSAVLEPQFSVQPAGWNENHDSDRGAQEWGTGKRNMIIKPSVPLHLGVL